MEAGHALLFSREREAQNWKVWGPDLAAARTRFTLKVFIRFPAALRA